MITIHTDQSNAPAVGPSPTAVIIGPRVPLAHVLNLHQADLGVCLHGMGNLGTTQVDRLERFQRRPAKIILRRPLFAPSNNDELLATIGWPSLASRRKYFQAVLGHRMATGNVPQLLRDYIPSRPTHMHSTRKPPFFQLPTTNTPLMLNSPLYQAADTFNALPAILQSASSLTSFKNGAALFLLTCQCTCSKHTSK